MVVLHRMALIVALLVCLSSWIVQGLSITSSASSSSSRRVLIIGGTRFSGASLWKELYDRGHDVTLYNRGKTTPKPLRRCGNHVENDWNFSNRMKSTKFIVGDRQDPSQLQQLINPNDYEYVYDMNARTVEDTKPLAELFVGSPTLRQYIFMSSAGVYLKSDEMPHREVDAVDPKSRHVGKLDSEQCLQQLKLPWCSFRPTYICGPGNYNPVERYFFERLDQNRPICVPGHGQHFTGLGHVYDLAVAMANCIGRESITSGRVYNCQNTQAVTFDGVAKIAARVMGKTEDPEIVHFNPKEFEFPKGAKAFPMRPQHFCTSSIRAMIDLDWKPVYDSVESILHDSYHNDFVHVKAAGKLKGDFVCDDIILSQQPKTNVAEGSMLKRW